MDIRGLLDARYAGSDAPAGHPDPVVETLLRHKSVRAFSSQPVERVKLEAPESLAGREKLLEHLKDMGFPLK
jgi:hypothetical protein